MFDDGKEAFKPDRSTRIPGFNPADLKRIIPDIIENIFETTKVDCLCVFLINDATKSVEKLFDHNCPKKGCAKYAQIKPLIEENGHSFIVTPEPSGQGFPFTSHINVFPFIGNTSVVCIIGQKEDSGKQRNNRKIRSTLALLENALSTLHVKDMLHDLQKKVTYRIGGNNSQTRIGIPSKNSIVFRSAGEIMYCISDSSYSHIYFIDSTREVISWPISKIEKKLGSASEFIRIHKSVIINKEYLKEMLRDKVIMEDGARLDIAARRRTELKKKLGVS